jgi:hypothetical protein
MAASPMVRNSYPLNGLRLFLIVFVKLCQDYVTGLHEFLLSLLDTIKHIRENPGRISFYFSLFMPTFTLKYKGQMARPSYAGEPHMI